MSNILKGLLNEGAYEEGFSDGMNGREDPRASSIYGPDSEKYRSGFSAGLKKREEERQARIQAYQDSIQPYLDIPTDELEQRKQAAIDRSNDIRDIYNKLRGSDYSFDPKRHTPPNNEELSAEFKRLHNEIQAIHQVLYQRQRESMKETKESDYGPDYQAMVKRVGQMAKEGPRKTVWDPVKRVYKTVPVNPPKKEQGVAEGSMKRIIGYRVVGTDIFIPIKDFEQDGRYYELRGHEFEPVWDDEQGVAEEQLDENLRQWFKEKWVRFGPDGKIRGACARGDDSEGKPKCLPQAKAHALGKKGRKYAASKKRREDPNPERRGPAKNVATKKKSNEGVAEGSGFDKWADDRAAKNIHKLNINKEVEKNPHTSAIGRALYRDLSKQPKLSPQQVQRNKDRWEQRQLEKMKNYGKSSEQDMAESVNDDFEQAHHNEVERYITVYGTPGEYRHKYDAMSNAHNSYLTYPGRTVTINTQQYGDRFGHNVFTKKEKDVSEEQLDELKCWPGYTRVRGVPAGAPGSCKKKTNEEELEEYGNTKKGQKMLTKVQKRAVDRMTSKQADTDPKYAKKNQDTANAAWERMSDKDLTEEKCPECGGPMFSDLILAEKKDACYHKVRSRYKVWPSAYASGALVQCRKKGASNWGTGGKKNEDIEEGQIYMGGNKPAGVRKYEPRTVPNQDKLSKQESAIMKGLQLEGNDEEFHTGGGGGLPNPGTYEQETKPFKSKGQRRTLPIAFEDKQLDEKWSDKYKRSIDCDNPKGFSQKAHCQGRKKK